MKVTNETIYLFTSRGSIPLSFRPGDMVCALVRDVTQEEVILLLNGHQARARSSVPLKPGEQVRLVLEERTDGGRLIFRLSSHHDSSRFADGEIQSLLRNWGFPVKEPNIFLARELNARGAAVTREEFLLLSNFLPAREVSPELIKSLVHLWVRGLSFNSSQLDALTALFRATEEALPDPFQILAKLGEEAFLAGDKLLLSSRDSRELLIGKLMGLTRHLGLDHEARLQEHVKESGGRDSLESHSLKSLLLSLAGAKVSREYPFFQARALLQVLTGLQLLHVHFPVETGSSLHLLGWLSLPQGVAPFFLSFSETDDKEGGAGKKTLRQVYVHTITPGLGRVLTELRLVESYLTCGVTVEKEETQKAVNGHRERLQKMLQDLPWPVIILPCRLAGPRIIQENWLNHLCDIEGEGKIDLRI